MCSASLGGGARLSKRRQNAQAALQLIDKFGSLNHYFWSWVDHTPVLNGFATHDQVPANTVLSDTISKDLKKRGFQFVGSTIIYAFMQSTGMVNDHTADCFLYRKPEN